MKQQTETVYITTDKDGYFNKCYEYEFDGHQDLKTKYQDLANEKGSTYFIHTQTITMTRKEFDDMIHDMIQGEQYIHVDDIPQDIIDREDNNIIQHLRIEPELPSCINNNGKVCKDHQLDDLISHTTISGTILQYKCKNCDIQYIENMWGRCDDCGDHMSNLISLKYPQ